MGSFGLTYHNWNRKGILLPLYFVTFPFAEKKRPQVPEYLRAWSRTTFLPKAVNRPIWSFSLPGRAWLSFSCSTLPPQA